jgi:CheY-like chemotaxis protein/two-component sensor histidine kinase
LRNPLAPIRNAAQLLGVQAAASPELRWASTMIERQVQQMTRLIDDLLDVSRITRGKITLRPERIDLVTVIGGVVEASRAMIAHAGHRLDVTVPDTPIPVDGDATRLAQIVLNLLHNAAKYTDPGGRIELVVARENRHVVIRVKDTGIGIPREMLPHIFELFTQVDRSLERSEGGLGIGLTLVQRLVELHGGSVAACSDGPGQGSEFVVRLPVAADPVDEAVRPQLEPALAAPAARRILIVDDNRDSANSLAELLHLRGHETHVAHDGLEALQVVAAVQPDVVLLDIGLPKMSGYEVAQRIRGQESGGDVVLIALTGWGQEEDRRRSRNSGFDHHLTKPIEFSALVKLLAGLPPVGRAVTARESGAGPARPGAG